MNQQHSPRIEPQRPHLGRVILSIAGALTVLIAAGIAFVQLSSPDESAPTAERTTARTSPASRQIADARASRQNATQSNTVTTIGGGNAVSSGSISGSAPSPPSGTVDSTEPNGESVASTSPSEPVQKIPVVETTEPMTYAEAERLFRERDYAGAAVGFASYVEAHPENVWGHYMEGLSLWKGGDLDAAETALMQALDRNPDHVKSLTNLARVRLEQGRNEQAILPAERAAQRSPEDVEVLRVYARALHASGRPADAALAYSKALQVDPNDVWSLNNLGLLWIEREEFSLALPPLARAAQIDSGIATIQNNLGIALERSGCFHAATEAYARALSADSTYAKAVDNKGRAEALIVTQSFPDPDLAELAASFDPNADIAALPRSRTAATAELESVESKPTSTLVPRDGAGSELESAVAESQTPIPSKSVDSATKR
ncbi:MAG: tetratricopeptide repeat protein [Candidatus Eisenbacteria bacterium]|uniref:Tetratricopeptide repeat protein n=1 Tax=Eiseniibacteriota bacterium TaxID=2212470 RepID=A0A956LXE3_UNCEI|nr:tetratricopeptide repeat protein [Candidatus Eisenbacteria bacterium]